MKEYIRTLESEFKKNSNPQIAIEQKAYMRNQFEFFGIKTVERREIQQPFFTKQFLPDKKQLHKIVKTLWQKPQREYHYFSQELTAKYLKQVDEKDITLFEWMVTHQSWWDTVDFIAVKLIGPYFQIYPEDKVNCIQKWLASDNRWLQRAAILFQLKYKDKTDTGLLRHTIETLCSTNDFFINKAIGWILREYSKTNATWVLELVDTIPLSTLSKREALKLI